MKHKSRLSLAPCVDAIEKEAESSNVKEWARMSSNRHVTGMALRSSSYAKL